MSRGSREFSLQKNEDGTVSLLKRQPYERENAGLCLCGEPVMVSPWQLITWKVVTLRDGTKKQIPTHKACRKKHRR